MTAATSRHPFTTTEDSAMANTEFLSLTDWETGRPIYLDPSKIASIQQIAACDQYARRTRIDLIQTSQRINLIQTSQTFLVSEDATQVALATGRGFFGPKDTQKTA
jgi:hypothetical protein